jgi:uncharacterized peroxidase-related enzyme
MLQTKSDPMNQPIVQPLSDTDDAEFNALIRFFEVTLGFCPNSVKTMYHRHEIDYAFIHLNKAVMANKGRVSSALKRLIGYISSNVAGCRYCQAHTIRAAERYGADNAQLEHIWEYRTHAAFSDAERAALEFAYASSTVPNSVDEEVAQTLRDHWDDGEIVEIMGVVALFGFLNRWNDAMGTPIEPEAVQSGEKLLSANNWSAGKHLY